MVMNVSLLVVTVHYDVSGIIMTMVRLVVTFVVLVVTVSYDGDSVSSGSDNMSTCVGLPPPQPPWSSIPESG